ncbi:DUF6226 family protein [Microbacterium sp. zg-YB36]|uniref:DUF6226 family protein n=1 Tax=Microbacterium sp. zg-YB36 TaxID=2969407 RepID=UPI00214CE09F|nr:DUF6226 family protein [Microbacterium sp. zg-YB36]MDL5350911.1 DUF6226 family protein [Microbacterium sp. zg-YB36]
MSDYARPVVDPQNFTDAEGAPIDYGTRWEGSPDPDAYSVVSHPERFAPLYVIADALIDWLTAEYDVVVEDDPSVASDLLHLPRPVERAVRITPRDTDAASVTFAFTDFPGVILHAGLLQDHPFPVCGCDACDETWQSTADDLEWIVRTVAQGGFTEALDPNDDARLYVSLEEPGVGSRSGSVRADEFPADRFDAVKSQLAGRGSWAPWPRRLTPVGDPEPGQGGRRSR